MKTNKSSLTSSIPRFILGIVASATALSFTACEVKKTQEGEAPEVTVKEGQMPKYDVDTAKVSVDSEKKEVTVPKVTTEKKQVTVPDVDITMPSEQTPTPNP
ncbi:MAG: hypothetical protein M3Q46_12240 [Verrucomicrobiota bacterium]|nr:hypothetical protein [Verrucomicrobiota bacterium]